MRICKCADEETYEFLMTEKPNLIVDLTFAFSLKIVDFTEELEARKKFSMANQLFRSGTSVGANVKEAQGAESKDDFRHKCKVAYKEAEETEYWLMICKHAKNYPFEQDMLDDIQSIIKILGKIISSTKK